MKKRILVFVLALTLLCTLLPIMPLSADAATELSATPNPQVEYGYTAETPVGTIRYIAQNIGSEYFSWNYWPTNSFGGYTGGPEIECGTACISMALSYVGVNRTPKALLEATNGYTSSMWGSQGDATSTAIAISQSAISSAMDNYINGNGKYSPLCVYIVPFSATSDMHWVLLVGKIGNNQYLALNPWHTSGTDGTFTIQVNGTTATYNGTTNPIMSVNQWYNPSATPPGATPSVIVNSYPSYCAIKTTEKTYVKSLPCSKDSDPNSTDVETASKGTQYQAIGLVENKFGNLWYKVQAKNGSTGYIYAGDTKYIAHSISDIKGSGITAPTTHTQGNIYLLTGTVSSTYNQLTQVSAYIYAGNSEQGPKETGGAASVSGNSYSLKNSTIDNQTAFNKLPVGIHTYVVWASYKNYYAKSATTVGMNTGETGVYKSTFNVTKGASGGTQTDRKPVAICDEVVGKEGGVLIRGWAFDPDTPSESVAIHVYVDNVLAGSCTANTSRPDVNNAYGCGNNHGFSATIPYNVSTTGTHSVAVYAINTTYGKEATGMGPFNVKISPHTCNKGTYMYFEEAHPHRDCYKCSVCNNVWAVDGTSNYYSSCSACNNTPKKPVLKVTSNYTDTSATTFTWEPTTNTTHYNLWIDKKSTSGKWETYEWLSYTSSGVSRNLPAGDYRLELQSYNSNAWNEDGSDWKHTVADHVYITIKCSHSYSSKVTKAATCANSGTKTYTCSKCGASYTETIAAKGHSWKNATCTAPKTCTTCGATSGSAKGHSWKNATCTAPKTCSTCGATSGSAKGHNWKNATCTAPKTCSTCGATSGSAKGHNWKAATCTAPKTCSTCGATSGSAKGHSWKNATCTAPKTCSTCGATSGNALGHSWKAATCDNPKICTRCKVSSGRPAGHTYDDNVDGTCNGCGIHRETTENRTVMHMFRMYDPNSGEHFYTGSTVERENLVKAGWHYEGVGFTFSMTTGAPVYRLYDRYDTFEHLYTMDVEERDRLVAEGWELEGIAFNSAYDTEVPQYRLHNPNETRGAYHFTASEEERDNLIAAGWEYQGIGFYSSWK